MNLRASGWRGGTPNFVRGWRGAVVGVATGALLGGAGGALAFDVSVDRHHMWWNGLRGENDNADGHPFLTSTDGAHREAAAAYVFCDSGYHSPSSKYKHEHVHRETDVWYVFMSAHVGSEQTGLGHHIHHPCVYE